MCAQSQYSPIKHLAISLFLNDWRDVRMAMFTAYFDGSGHADSTATVVVAGFIAPIDQWLKFETSWKECLAEFGVTSLHMKHFAHSRGEYSKWKDDEKKRQAFLGKLIKIIKRRTARSFASAVRMEDYRKVDLRFQISEYTRPYPLAAMTCVTKLIKTPTLAGVDKNQILYVFEHGDQDQGQLAKTMEEAYRITPVFWKKDRSVAFQAADLLAYEQFNVNTALSKLAAKEVLEFEKLRFPLRALSEMPGSEDWGVHLEDDMTDSCKKIKVRLRDAGI